MNSTERKDFLRNVTLFQNLGKEEVVFSEIPHNGYFVHGQVLYTKVSDNSAKRTSGQPRDFFPGTMVKPYLGYPGNRVMFGELLVGAKFHLEGKDYEKTDVNSANELSTGMTDKIFPGILVQHII